MPKQARAKTPEKESPRANNRPRKMPKHSYARTTAEEDKHDVRDARLALKEAGRKGGVPWDQVKRELEI